MNKLNTTRTIASAITLLSSLTAFNVNATLLTHGDFEPGVTTGSIIDLYRVCGA